MLDSFLKFVANSLHRKANPDSIRAYLRAKGMRPASALERRDPSAVRIAAVQEELRVLRTWQAYADRMHAFVARAAEQGAQLVCFPEENGLLLLGQLPLIDLILKVATRPHADTAPQVEPAEAAPVDLRSSAWDPHEPSGGLDVAHILSFFTPFFQDAFEAVFSELARGFGVYVMAGSCMQVVDGRPVNRATLFGPQGETVGVQDKAHPTDLEMSFGLAPAAELKTFATRLGRLAFPVCMDATYFETFKILRSQGAQIVLLPIANLEPYNRYWALRGIWPRVQENAVYGVKSALVGKLYGLEFTGKAGFYAPLGLTPDRSGVLAEATSFDRDELVVASLDLTKLEAYRSDYFDDTNPALYRRYFPQIYG
jgi:predicted amidohydrolase